MPHCVFQEEGLCFNAQKGSLPFLAVPTLAVGGKKDNTLGGQPSREIADRIPGTRLRMYEGYGHGVYEEAYQERMRFLRQKLPLLQR